MCGIVGSIGIDDNGALVRRMADIIRHRGPDGDGFHVKGAVALGMRRLSIIDVAGGDQPIYNEDGTIGIVYNGEVYNFQDLRLKLEARGHRFRTHSDTETIVHLYEEYGDACVDHLRGMFAFALHDMRRDRVLIARDRLGKKPVYYHCANGRLLFASEIKALLECPLVPREPDLAGVDAYLTLRYSPGPESMFAGVLKLPAAHRMVWEKGALSIERYWDPVPCKEMDTSSADYASVERFAKEFEESVRLRMIADVPIGAFLSGGVDFCGHCCRDGQKFRPGQHVLHRLCVGGRRARRRARGCDPPRLRSPRCHLPAGGHGAATPHHLGAG